MNTNKQKEQEEENIERTRRIQNGVGGTDVHYHVNSSSQSSSFISDDSNSQEIQ